MVADQDKGLRMSEQTQERHRESTLSTGRRQNRECDLHLKCLLSTYYILDTDAGAWGTVRTNKHPSLTWYLSEEGQ